MIEATFHLRGGQSVAVECENCELKYLGNDLTSYTIDGMSNKFKARLMYVKLEHISMITTKELQV